MKRIALLSFIIGLLAVPIQAQAADPSEELRLFLERQEEVAKVLSNIAAMRHQMMKLVLENLPREPEQNAAPPTQYYPAPPAQRATSATDAQTKAILELQRRMRNAEQLRSFNAGFYGGRY